MHISTHQDRIWQSGCHEKENRILSQLTALTNNKSFVKLVDAVLEDEVNRNSVIITDSVFIKLVDRQIVSLAPNFWGIFAFNSPIIDTTTPTKQFNFLVNRIAEDRLLFLYKLVANNLLNQGIVSFNCLYHDLDPSTTQRQNNFSKVHCNANLEKYNAEFNMLHPLMPMLLEDNNVESAMLNSKVTIVFETYASDFTISFSEKIFRALQTPRPWLLYCSAGAVALLRKHGFDVLDDLIDHSYDNEDNLEKRMDLIIKQIPNIVFNQKRCIDAAIKNQKKLTMLFNDLDHQMSHLSQSMGFKHHSLVNLKSSG